MTSQLAVYNKALGHIGERKLASLSENRESRRALDDWWEIDTFLESGLWRFARRTARLDYSPSIEPPFGYSRAFQHPDDFVRTAMLSADEFFSLPLHQYATEAGHWFAEVDQIYVSYISNDSSYGGDLSLWAPSFTEWVSGYLASKICMRLTGDAEKSKEMIKLERDLLTVSKSRDAMEEPSKRPPSGTWVNSRSGRITRGDRGNRNSLLG